MNDKNETPKIIRLVETDSTNNYLREQSAKARLPEGSLVIADFQTAGKGQVGNSWESEAGKNLMFSILLYPDFLPANRQFLISQIASLSVYFSFSVIFSFLTIFQRSEERRVGKEC